MTNGAELLKIKVDATTFEKGLEYFVSNILSHSYQNLINKRHVCKNNYPLTRVFQFLVN